MGALAGNNELPRARLLLWLRRSRCFLGTGSGTGTWEGEKRWEKRDGNSEQGWGQERGGTEMAQR